jgi:SAM-dependent methyltransferase
MSSRFLVNLGCGSVWHAAWRNFDLAPFDPAVMPIELPGPLPLPDGCADVVYHSHLLEHLTLAGGAALLAECFRIAKPGGIVRVAVPDLEQLANHYLTALQHGGDLEYDWAVLAWLDQLVRERSEGAMGEFLRMRPWRDNDAICTRVSAEIGAAREGHERLIRRPDTMRRKLRGLRFRLARMCLARGEKEILDTARFRADGEVHRWMYDRRSLARVLVTCGFCEPVGRGATESAISEFAGYALDTDAAGRPRHPGSLYMEASKP